MRRVLVILALVNGLVSAAPALAQSGRFQGLWEGTFHGGLGAQAMALTVRARGASGFVGALYQDGREMGPVEGGRVAGDSLTFSLMGFDVVAIGAGERLAVDLIVRNGRTHHFDMTRTTADTTRLPAAPLAARALTREEPPDSVYRAHAVPAGAATSFDPSLRKGTLLLVGGGPAQPDIERRFVELAGGPDADVVLIPTAAVETADPAALDRFAAAGIMGLRHVTVLHTTSRREADSEAFVAPLRRATGVWILGGEGSWLLDSYLGTRTERELVALLARGGVVGGTSAGAVIWTSTLLTFHADTASRELQPMKLENLVIGDRRSTGIGLLRNATLAPHCAQFGLEPALRKLVDATPGLLGIGVDESTALEVHDGVGRVLGRGTVTIYPGTTAAPPARLRDGARYDLIRRKPL